MKFKKIALCVVLFVCFYLGGISGVRASKGDLIYLVDGVSYNKSDKTVTFTGYAFLHKYNSKGNTITISAYDSNNNFISTADKVSLKKGMYNFSELFKQNIVRCDDENCPKDDYEYEDINFKVIVDLSKGEAECNSNNKEVYFKIKVCTSNNECAKEEDMRIFQRFVSSVDNNITYSVEDGIITEGTVVVNDGRLRDSEGNKIRDTSSEWLVMETSVPVNVLKNTDFIEVVKRVNNKNVRDYYLIPVETSTMCKTKAGGYYRCLNIELDECTLLSKWEKKSLNLYHVTSGVDVYIAESRGNFSNYKQCKAYFPSPFLKFGGGRAMLYLEGAIKDCNDDDDDWVPCKNISGTAVVDSSDCYALTSSLCSVVTDSTNGEKMELREISSILIKPGNIDADANVKWTYSNNVGYKRGTGFYSNSGNEPFVSIYRFYTINRKDKAKVTSGIINNIRNNVINELSGGVPFRFDDNSNEDTYSDWKLIEIKDVSSEFVSLNNVNFVLKSTYHPISYINKYGNIVDENDSYVFSANKVFIPLNFNNSTFNYSISFDRGSNMFYADYVNGKISCSVNVVGNFAGISYIYRPISLTSPFANRAYGEIGLNWRKWYYLGKGMNNGLINLTNSNRLQNTYVGDDGKHKEPDYSVTLTNDMLETIRRMNARDMSDYSTITEVVDPKGNSYFNKYFSFLNYLEEKGKITIKIRNDDNYNEPYKPGCGPSNSYRSECKQ